MSFANPAPFEPSYPPITLNRAPTVSMQMPVSASGSFALLLQTPRAGWPFHDPHLTLSLSLLDSLRDPDSVVLCLLAIDEEEEDDIALQIHFTLIQSFCCDNDIDIMRVSGMQRLAQLLGEPTEVQGTTEARDLHCLLVTVSWVPAPPRRVPGPVFVNKVRLTSPAQLSTQPCLACPVGSPAPGLLTQAAILSWPVFPKGAQERESPHLLLGLPLTHSSFLPQNPHSDAWKSHGLVEVASYCEESRGNNQWVPYISLQER